MLLPKAPKYHFFINADIVMSGKPFIAENPISLIAMLIMNIFGGVRSDLDLQIISTDSSLIDM